MKKAIQSVVKTLLKMPLRTGFFGALLITLLIFFKSTTNNLVQWDNAMYVLNNPYIQTITLENIIKLCGIYIYWMPLTWLSHLIDYQIAGPKPFTHLFGNVLLHSINTGILFIVAYKLLNLAKPKTDKALLFLLIMLKE